MDAHLRRILSFECEGNRLAATLDEASSTTGLLIISGGNEIRIGAHRGMAKLAADIAAAGHPVFRFDRRGIGDSEGENGGFESSRPDIEGAITAFRMQSPKLSRIVAFGNCDAASALMLHEAAGLSHAVISNPWVIEAEAGQLPPAAIKSHYARRLRDPTALLGLFTGAVDLRKLASGLGRIAKTAPPSPLAQRVAEGMAIFPAPITVVLATRDATACGFAGEWNKPAFTAARARDDVAIVRIDSASHSFVSATDYAALKRVILEALAQ